MIALCQWGSIQGGKLSSLSLKWVRHLEASITDLVALMERVGHASIHALHPAHSGIIALSVQLSEVQGMSVVPHAANTLQRCQPCLESVILLLFKNTILPLIHNNTSRSINQITEFHSNTVFPLYCRTNGWPSNHAHFRNATWLGPPKKEPFRRVCGILLCVSFY